MFSKKVCSSTKLLIQAQTFSKYLRKNLFFEFFMRKELCIDMDVGEKHNPDVFLIHPIELEELRNHVSPIQRQRQKTLLSSTHTRACTSENINTETNEEYK